MYNASYQFCTTYTFNNKRLHLDIVIQTMRWLMSLIHTLISLKTLWPAFTLISCKNKISWTHDLNRSGTYGKYPRFCSCHHAPPAQQRVRRGWDYLCVCWGPARQWTFRNAVSQLTAFAPVTPVWWREHRQELKAQERDDRNWRHNRRKVMWGKLNVLLNGKAETVDMNELLDFDSLASQSFWLWQAIECNVHVFYTLVCD